MHKRAWAITVVLLLATLTTSAISVLPTSAGTQIWQPFSTKISPTNGPDFIKDRDSIEREAPNPNSVAALETSQGIFGGSPEICDGRALYWMGPLCCTGWICPNWVWQVGSDTLNLGLYTGKYVRLTGFQDSSSCGGFLNVTGIEVLLNPCPAWTWRRLSNNPGDSTSPAVAVWGSNVHVVWSDDTFGNSDIFYKRSTDNGNTWTWRRLSSNPGWSRSPALAVSGNNIHVVWADTTFGNSEIFYKRSTDNGNTWTWRRLSSNSGWSEVPDVAVSGSNVHVVWADDTFGGNLEVFYKRSTNNGNTWAWQRLSNNSGWSGFPAVAASGSNVHVVWEDNTFGNSEVFYKRSTNNGSWWNWQRLSSNAGWSSGPDVAADGNNVHVVWSDDTFGQCYNCREVFYKRSTNNGFNWSWQRLSSNSGWSGAVTVATMGDNVRVVWQDQSFGDAEIFYEGSDDSGGRWAWQQLSNNSGYSEMPDVAVGTSGTDVVWMDDTFTFGINEIFDKHGN